VFKTLWSLLRHARGRRRRDIGISWGLGRGVCKTIFPKEIQPPSFKTEHDRSLTNLGVHVKEEGGGIINETSREPHGLISLKTVGHTDFDREGDVRRGMVSRINRKNARIENALDNRKTLNHLVDEKKAT